MTDFKKEAYFDKEASVYRWKSNNAIPFEDMLAKNNVGIEIIETCNKVRDEEQLKFFAEYTEQQKKFWESADTETKMARREVLAEMRAAFGTNTTVTNCITGRSFKV